MPLRLRPKNDSIVLPVIALVLAAAGAASLVGAWIAGESPPPPTVETPLGTVVARATTKESGLATPAALAVAAVAAASPIALPSTATPTVEPLETATPTAEPQNTATPTRVAPTSPPPAVAVVTANVLNVRSEPGLDGEIVATLVAGQTVQVVDGPTTVDGRAWYQIATAEITGWCAAEFLRIT